jgi:aryl-alcohol dehydrogenase-like predicted oxidoreductase
MKKLGTAGLMVPPIGLGCMGMSAMFYGGAPEDRSIATLHAAIDHGMNLIDTSDMYGFGHNEELVGKVVRQRRNEVVLATKFGFVLREDGQRVIDCRPERVREACEASLRRLGVDTIDLYYMHRLDRNVPVEETVGAMAELVKEGKVRYIGLSEVSADTLRRASRVHPITALQSELSIWTRDIEADIIPACRELGIGIVAYSPLGRGMLSGRIRSRDDFAPNDSRHRMPRFMGDNFEHNLQVVREVDRIAEEKGVTPAQVALAWVMSRGDDIVPIPGTTRPEHVVDNLGALQVKLTEEELRRLEPIASRIKGERYDPDRMSNIDK